jgi:hypothetical protein
MGDKVRIGIIICDRYRTCAGGSPPISTSQDQNHSDRADLRFTRGQRPRVAACGRGRANGPSPEVTAMLSLCLTVLSDLVVHFTNDVTVPGHGVV